MTKAKLESEFARYWPLVLVCALGVGIGIASLAFYTQSVFIDEWMQEFGWTRTQASLGILASTFTLAIVSPFVGAAVDRFGLIPPIAFALCGLVISFILLAVLMNSLGAFIALNVLMALLAGASSPLAYTRAINSVFIQNRGLALGLVLSGTGIAATFAPAIVADLIDQSGWRATYLYLALFTAVSAVAIVFVLRRLTSREEHQPVQSADSIAAFKDASRSSAYRRLLIAVFLLAIGVGGLIIHFIPILTEQGVARGAAAKTMGILGIAVIVGRLVVGAAVDRAFAPYVAASVIGLCILGILALAFVGAEAAPVAAFAIGFAIGAEVDLIGYMVARYFGMSAYGRLYGRQYGAFLLGTGLSPVLIGRIADVSGGYQIALLCASTILSLSAAVFISLPRFSNTQLVH